MIKTWHYILAVVVLIIIVIMVWPDGDYQIQEVVDGNTVIMKSGTTVNLIGISSTEQSKKELEDIIDGDFRLVPDKSAFFVESDNLGPDDVVYAYLLLEDGNYYECINATILKKGLAELQEETFLTDSLDAFRKYAIAGKSKREVDPTPTPVPVIDYEDDSIKLPEPPSPEYKRERKHSCWYCDGNQNLEMLDEACDYTCPYTKQFANSLAKKSPGNFNIGQVCAIFDYCYNKWKYVNDPSGKEYLAMASETIEYNLVGDCDDFAVLMASCILAIGGDACINTGQNSQGGHAFTEVDISRFSKSDVLKEIKERFPLYNITNIHTRNANGKVWMNLDWQAAYPGGPYYDCCNGRDAYPCINGVWSWNKIR